MRSAAVAVAVLTLAGAAPMAAQNPDPIPSPWSVDVAGGMNRYGPQAFGGLEYAMNRWLALRSEALFTLHGHPTWPAYRLWAGTIAGVATLGEMKRVTPYLMSGPSISFAQGGGMQQGLMTGGGLRLRLGRLQPYVELRNQHRLGWNYSLGLRF